MKRAGLTLLLSILALQPAQAQEGEAAEDFMAGLAPSAEHLLLEGLEGEWQVYGRMRFDPTAAWDGLDARASMEMILDGMQLAMELRGEQTETWPKPYRSRRLLGFNTLSERWHLVIADNLGTRIVFAEGNRGADPSHIGVRDQLEWPRADGESSIAWRADLRVESDDRLVWHEYLAADGQEEHLGIEAVFTRQPDATSRLLGQWKGRGRGGAEMIFDFRHDSTATWTVQTPGGTVQYDVDYTLDDSQTPQKLDLIGIDSGPLRGKTLYAIVEFTDETSFRLDLEPGEPGSSGDGVRPSGFDEQDTVLFQSVEIP